MSSQNEMFHLMLIIFTSFQFLPIGAEKLPNVDYFGQGYDITLANPHSDIQDTGFKATVLKLTYVNGKSFRSWEIPDESNVLDSARTANNAHTEIINDVNNYARALSAEIGAYGGYGSAAAFSLNADYNTIKKNTRSCTIYYTESSDICTCYSVSADIFAMQVTDTFISAVNSLPISRNDQAYRIFIANYGTHFTKQIVLGAKVVMRAEFTSANWTKSEVESLNLRAGGNAKVGLKTGEINASLAVDETTIASFSKVASKETYYYQGPMPSPSSVPDWSQLTCSNPSPISYQMDPIENLFTTRYIRNETETTIGIKQQLLIDALIRYCGPGITADCSPSNATTVEDNGIDPRCEIPKISSGWSIHGFKNKFVYLAAFVILGTISSV